ncbi:type II toxin-antitoxin system RatA family toxin [Eilatimonas milleporae]|uniref:Coenzyme Q-binding protein COQ10 n=1 Tax=Eilatimonas milleporae TaxID=911205 RepID=A0A3M0CGM9_9PROT|nr:type II toxin-antitoxin system RatA family toxin [Eilatimonas milleporae]RMB08781.1 coenzyme Q-binding protein COQ10 [Eilatimonas milleporae]
MPHFTEKKTLPYSPEQLFDMVSDVTRYPEFLPWCVGARVYNRKADGFDADLLIGFKAFRERFTSRVTLTHPTRVYVDYLRGPLKRLYNHWDFEETADGCCAISFEVDLEFKSRTLEALIGGVFTRATQKMVSAFEDRAAILYGPPAA